MTPRRGTFDPWIHEYSREAEFERREAREMHRREADEIARNEMDPAPHGYCEECVANAATRMRPPYQARYVVTDSAGRERFMCSMHSSHWRKHFPRMVKQLVRGKKA